MDILNYMSIVLLLSVHLSHLQFALWICLLFEFYLPHKVLFGLSELNLCKILGLPTKKKSCLQHSAKRHDKLQRYIFTWTIIEATFDLWPAASHLSAAHMFEW